MEPAGLGSPERDGEWRQAHPKATLAEIEAETDRRLAELRARIIQDAAQASPVAAMGSEVARPVCPRCGCELVKNHKRKRRMTTWHEQTIELVHQQLIYPQYWPGVFSLDEEPGLVAGQLTPLRAESLARLGTWLPCERAAARLAVFTQTRVSTSSARRGTEAAGAAAFAVVSQAAAGGTPASSLVEAGEAFRRDEPACFPEWFTTWRHELKTGSPHQAVAELHRSLAAYNRDAPQGVQTAIDDAHDYLKSRLAMIQYAHGDPIGSGASESANKLVVEGRRKGRGMHWQRAKVNPILALTNAVANDRWDEVWAAAVRHRRDERRPQQLDRYAPPPPPPLTVPALSPQAPSVRRPSLASLLRHAPIPRVVAELIIQKCDPDPNWVEAAEARRFLPSLKWVGFRV